MNACRQRNWGALCLLTHAVVNPANLRAKEQLVQERTTADLSEPALPDLEREILFAEFAPLVRRLIRQYGRQAEIRQDLTCEIYYRFCTLLDRYDPKRGVPLRPYLVRQLSAAVYTYARHHWQLQKREVALENNSETHFITPVLDPTSSWIAALSHEQVAATLPNALAKLPQRQRQVVIWRYYEDRSFEEIASLLVIQPATARSLLRHGLNSLRKMVPQDTAHEE